MRLACLAIPLGLAACADPPAEPAEPVVLLALGIEDAVAETIAAGDRFVHVVRRDRGERTEIVVTGPAGEDPRVVGDHAGVRVLPGGDVIGCTAGRLERLDPAAGAFTPLFDRCGDVIELGDRLVVLSDAAWMTPGRLAVREADGSERALGDDILPGVVAHDGELVAITAASALVAIDPDSGARRTLGSGAFAFEIGAAGRLAWESRDGTLRVRPSLDGTDREVARLIPPDAGPPYDVFHLEGEWIYALDDLQSLLLVASLETGATFEVSETDLFEAAHAGRFVLARHLGGTGEEARFAHLVWTPGREPSVAFADLPYGTTVAAIDAGLIAATSNGLDPGPLWFAPWDGAGQALVADGPRFATPLGDGRVAILTHRRQQAGAEDWSSAYAQLGRLRVVDLATGADRELAADVRAAPEPQWLAGGVVFDRVDEAAGTSARLLVPVSSP